MGCVLKKLMRSAWSELRRERERERERERKREKERERERDQYTLVTILSF